MLQTSRNVSFKFQIAPNALKGLRLTRFFINSNRLYFLPENTFDSWNIDELEAVDLSDNQWECICGSEWIGPWLNSLGERNTPSGDLGCLLYRCDESIEKQRDQHSLIITIIASCLAVVAFLFLLAIAYLYIQENCYGTVPIKRMPSDMVRLIPSMESLSYPNPFAPSILKNTANIDNSNSSPPSTGTSTTPTTILGESPSKLEKKRVRFGGI